MLSDEDTVMPQKEPLLSRGSSHHSSSNRVCRFIVIGLLFCIGLMGYQLWVTMSSSNYYEENLMKLRIDYRKLNLEKELVDKKFEACKNQITQGQGMLKVKSKEAEEAKQQLDSLQNRVKEQETRVSDLTTQLAESKQAVDSGIELSRKKEGEMKDQITEVQSVADQCQQKLRDTTEDLNRAKQQIAELKTGQKLPAETQKSQAGGNLWGAGEGAGSQYKKPTIKPTQNDLQGFKPNDPSKKVAVDDTYNKVGGGGKQDPKPTPSAGAPASAVGSDFGNVIKPPQIDQSAGSSVTQGGNGQTKNGSKIEGVVTAGKDEGLAGSSKPDNKGKVDGSIGQLQARGTPQGTGKVSGTQQASGQAAGTQQASGQAAGTQQASVQAAGTQQASGQAAGTQQASGQAAGTQQASGQAAGTQQASGQAAGTQQASGQVAGTQQASGQAAGTQQASGQAAGTQQASGSAGTQQAAGQAAGTQQGPGQAAGTQQAFGKAAGIQLSAGQAAGTQKAPIGANSTAGSNTTRFGAGGVNGTIAPAAADKKDGGWLDFFFSGKKDKKDESKPAEQANTVREGSTKEIKPASTGNASTPQPGAGTPKETSNQLGTAGTQKGTGGAGAQGAGTQQGSKIAVTADKGDGQQQQEGGSRVGVGGGGGVGLKSGDEDDY